jgi:hypothetical protein
MERMMKEVTLAANTWTNISAAVAEVGNHLYVLTDLTDAKIGRKATAPTDGPALVAGQATEVIIKQGDTLVLWAFSTAGGKIKLLKAGANRVVIDGTGTT